MRLAHVYLVATTILTHHLTCHLLARHGRGGGQQSQSRQTVDIPFHMLGVAHLPTHHLITATDAHDGGSLTMRPNNRLCHSVAAQFVEVAEGGFATRDEDDVALEKVIGIVRVEEVYPWVTLQHVEIGEVGEMTQEHYCHVHFPLFGLHGLRGKIHAVLLLDVDVFVIRHNTQDGHATQFFQHLSPLIKEAQVTTELIDDDSLDTLSVFGSLQGDAAIDGSKHTATVDVTHQNHVSIGIPCHRHVHEVTITKIDFGDAARPFHHNGIEALGQTVEGSTDFLAEVDRPSPRPSPIMGRETIRMVLPIMGEMSVRAERAFSPEIVGIPISNRHTVEHHLTGVVTLGLQKEGVHICVARDACRFCLHGLGTTNLQPFRGGEGVQCHVLRLEGGGMKTILQENTAQCRGKNALTHVAASTCQHDGAKRAPPLTLPTGRGQYLCQ